MTDFEMHVDAILRNIQQALERIAVLLREHNALHAKLIDAIMHPPNGDDV